MAGHDPELVSAAIGRIHASTGATRFNLNAGCPSQRVSRCEFGAVLMRRPQRIAAILRRVHVDHPHTELSLKCRLGIDNDESFESFHTFIDAVVRHSPLATVIVHARNAILGGLDTNDNRTVPPLKYEYVYRIADLFPHVAFVLNGGINDFDTLESTFRACPQLSGVMLGRWPYERDPLMVAEIEKRKSPFLIVGYFSSAPHQPLSDIVSKYIEQLSTEHGSRMLVSRPVCALLRCSTNDNRKELNRRIARILQDEQSTPEVLNKLAQLC